MNVMTPEQAATQVCPFIHVLVNEEQVIHEGKAPLYVHQSCQGPACLVGWRRARVPSTETFREVGYCGAFGGPQVEDQVTYTGRGGFDLNEQEG